jgi:hypothetical protein
MATTGSGTEPFPQLFAREQVKPISTPNGNETKVTRRRKSSGLGQEIRAGDTGAPAIATLDVTPPSPNTIKVSNCAESKVGYLMVSRPKPRRIEKSHSQNVGRLKACFEDGEIMHSKTHG